MTDTEIVTAQINALLAEMGSDELPMFTLSDTENMEEFYTAHIAQVAENTLVATISMAQVLKAISGDSDSKTAILAVANQLV
jgi:hypothetical protein